MLSSVDNTTNSPSPSAGGYEANGMATSPMVSPEGDVAGSPGPSFASSSSTDNGTGMDGVVSDSQSAEFSVAVFSSSMVPSSKTLAEETGLPLGFHLTPLCPLSPSPASVRRQPVLCQYCLASIHRYTDVSGREWHCTFCGGANLLDEGEDATGLPELQLNTVEYVDSFVDVRDEGELILFALDENLDEEEQETLKQSLVDVVSTLPSDARVGLLSFSGTVSVYDLQASGVSSAEVLTGITSPELEDLQDLAARMDSYVVPAMSSIDNLRVILDTLYSPSKAHAQETLKQRRERQRRARRQRAEAKRCLGVVLELALGLISGRLCNASARAKASSSTRVDSSRLGTEAATQLGQGGRLIVALGGQCNYGPGAIVGSPGSDDMDYYGEFAQQYYSAVGLFANQHNVVVDIHCCGPKDFYTHTMQETVQRSGGSLLLRADFGPRFVADIQLCRRAQVGSNATLLLRASDSVHMSHVIGNAVPDYEPAPGVSDKWFAEFGNAEADDGAVLVRMGSANTTHTLTFEYEVDDEVLAEHVLLQFAVQYTTRTGQRITRIATHQLVCTEKSEQYLESINVDELSVLEAKLSVLQARKQPDEDTLDTVFGDIDQKVFRLAALTGSFDTSTNTYKMQRSLSSLPKLLYMLRRGPMLGPILQHPDDIDCIRVLFLGMSVANAHRLIIPVVWWFYYDDNQRVASLQISPDDLALMKDKVVLMDSGTDLFVWQGSAVQSDELRQAALFRAEQLASGRFPSPRINSFNEGDSMSRYLLARLAPLHKDKKAHQRSSFPWAEGVPADNFASFPPTSEESFYVWMSEVGVSVVQ